MKILELTNWQAPACLPEGRSGRFRVVCHGHESGVFHLHRQYGDYEYYGLPLIDGRRTRYTRLQEKRKGRWKDWMTDEPLYWMAMYNLAQRVKGPNVLIGGLGLGLVLRHLAPRRDLKRIVVVERSVDVIRLTGLPLRKRGVLDDRFTIVHADFFDLKERWRHHPFDTVLTDFWVGSPWEKQLQTLFLKTWGEVDRWWPKAMQLYHGLEAWANVMAELKAVDGLTDLRPEQVLSILNKMAERRREAL